LGTLLHPIIRVRLCLLAAWTLLCVDTVWSSGTPAGTVISLQVSATFTAPAGGTALVVSSNIVSVTVTQVAALNLTPSTGSRASPLNTSVDYPSTIVNSGNGPDNIRLAASSSLGLAALVYRDVNGNGVLDPPEIGAGPIALTGSIPEDSSVHIVTRLVIPGTISLNGQTDVLTLVATSSFDASRTASGVYSTAIESAVLSGSMAVTSSIPRPGDRVTYTLTYANSGIQSAAGVTVTDVLDNALVFVTGSATPAPASSSGGTVVWNLGSIAANSGGSLTFQAGLASTAIPGTEIHNPAALHYSDGPNGVTITSGETSFITVRGGTGVTVDLAPAQTGAGEPGDTVDYPFVLTSNGSQPESFGLTDSSSMALPWTFYQDLNGNGRVDPGEPVVTSTGAVPGGGRFLLVARTVLPVPPSDGTVDVTTFIATSLSNSANRGACTGTSTMNIPVMSLVKSALAPVPTSGQIITYSITYANSGSGRALQFVVSDAFPANATYVPGSVKHNNVPKTDASDGDEVTVAGNLLTVNVGTVMAHASGTIEFKVQIH